MQTVRHCPVANSLSFKTWLWLDPSTIISPQTIISVSVLKKSQRLKIRAHAMTLKMKGPDNIVIKEMARPTDEEKFLKSLPFSG